MTGKRLVNMAESLTDLPPNILMEILVRLPIETIFAARCVCKTFLNLTAPRPHFTALHASIAAPALIFQFGDLEQPSRLLSLLEPDHDVAPGKVCSRSKPLFLLPRIRRTDIIYYRSNIRDENNFVLVNSCNGLLYLVRRNTSDERSIVLNPVTNEYVMLPDVDKGSGLRVRTKSMWLGFDQKNNHHEILRIFSSIDDPLVVEAQVLVVGSNTWKGIDDTPLGYDHSCDACCVLDGVIYWLELAMNGVVLFDFGTKKFGYIALPCDYMDEEQMRTRLCIGSLKGRLCLTYNDLDASRVNLWVMKPDGNWCKEFVVDVANHRNVYGLFKPLQVLRNGEILMHLVGNDLVCYDPRNESLRFVGFYHLKRGHPRGAVALIPSFVSLVDILKVHEGMVQVIVHYERPRASVRIDETDP